MKALLDTHSLLWFLEGNSEHLSINARGLIEKQEVRKFVSIVSLWEVVIKSNLGKLKLNRSLPEFKALIDFNGFSFLPILFEHTVPLLNLELHHRDPFDRMLISQAIAEEMVVITKDKNFSFYNIKTIW
ncbi:MAG: type II toxin-antitoxin system VapC family toxin [Cyclobacteriaceae bacterium]|nr:type II toxin-antitoxin system VapC family toxin [Cyclobacteriaceae bacterium]